MRQTRLERIEQLCRALTLAVPLLAGAGCLSQHEGPSASDTATNWLKSCTSDSVCGGGRCIDKVCKTLCAAPNKCQWLDESASCESDGNGPAACDLTCTTNSICEAFRVGYTCQSGRCRVATLPPLPPLDAGPPEAPELEDTGTAPQTGSDSATTPPPETDSATPETDAGNTGISRGVLVSAIAVDESGFIATPHSVRVLRAADGLPLDPPIAVVTTPDTGAFNLPPIPGGVPIALHVVGQGAAGDAMSTFDAVHIGFDARLDPLLRVGSVGTASLPSVTGQYTARSDAAHLDVEVLRSDVSGKYVGAVGCAQAFLDGSATVAAAADLRYVAATGLPTTLAQLSATRRGSGRLVFGNISKGAHTLQISVDGGATFIAELPFYVPMTRSEAWGSYKDVRVRLSVPVTGPDPTPASCPQ